MPEENIRRKRRLSSFQIIILGFAGVILLGALLLMLPISTTAGGVTPFNETLFTATSAVCVTGLVVQDTGSYWSTFGQAVILVLIQIGGLGVVTVAASFALLSGRKISLMQRSTMKDAISAPKVGGIVRLTRFILRGTFLIELLGALAMLPAFCRDYGWRGVWMAVFHSISAFCNAGFDILGTENNLYPSLTGYAGSPGINITIMLLIVIGGIGFLTWDDVCENKWRFHRYRMQSKVILVTTFALIVLPALLFFFLDFDALPLGERIQAALFQSITPRTAGFNTVTLSAMSGASQGVMILLMLIGGSPGSTAGGMKTTPPLVFADIVPCQKANAANHDQQHNRNIDYRTASIAGKGWVEIAFRSKNVKSSVAECGYRMKHRHPDAAPSIVPAEHRQHGKCAQQFNQKCPS